MLSIITGRSASKNLLVWAILAIALLSVSACDKVPLLAPGLSTITLSTTNTVVQSNGTAQVSATVLEQSGTPVQNGTTVTFSTTLGTLSPTEARTVNGVATTQFIANGLSGVAEIRATSGAAKPADTANPSLKLTVGGAAAARVLVTANPNRVPSGGSSTITATISDTSGNAISGVTVAFTTTAGTLSNSVATTNSSGQVVTTLTTTKDATVTATVSAAGTTAVLPGTVLVTVSVLPTLSFGTTTPASPVQGQAVTFIVIPGTTGTDTFQSVVIDFGDGESRNLGAITASTPVSHVYNSAGTFTVIATGTSASGGDSSRATTIIFVAPPTPISVNLSSTQAASGGFTTVNFTATVTPAGTPVSSYVWNFGDPLNTSRTTTGNQTSFSYVTASGPKQVSVTVTTTTGQTGTTSTTVVP